MNNFQKQNKKIYTFKNASGNDIFWNVYIFKNQKSRMLKYIMVKIKVDQ